MTESILKYISNQNLDLGVGVSSTGEVKQSAFECSSNSATAISKVNKDEFGYNYINETKDYEKLKQFHFGIDLSNALPTASLNTLLNVDTNKSLKSNETYMHAYRKIIKNEISVDSTKLPKFSDDALSMLKQSTRKFHDTYGCYYITGMTKGGALSIIGRMVTRDTSKKTDIDQKFAIGGNVSKVCKANVSDEIAYKKSQLNTYQFNECFSSSIGLSEETKKADFAQMLNQLEELDKHIDEGSVLFYTIQKYELCSEYTKIVNQKSKWQMFAEQFDALNLDIQRANIDLYKQIQLNLTIATSEKLQEIDIELKLRALVQQNDYVNMLQRIDQCSNFLSNNSVALAIETLGSYISSDNLCSIVMKVFQSSFSNFCKIIEFSRQLKLDSDAALVHLTLFNCMKEKQLLSTPEFIQFAYYVHERATSSASSVAAAKEMFTYLSQHALPACLYRIYWNDGVTIACSKGKSYLYNSGEFLYSHNKEIKRVFTYETNNFDSARWLFSTTDCGKTFTIMNKANGEYLLLVDNMTDCVDGIFTAKPHRIAVTQKRIVDASYWCVELCEEGVLRLCNAKTRDYLYTESVNPALIRGNVYGGSAIEKEANLHCLFAIENISLKKNESSSNASLKNVGGGATVVF